MTPPHTRREAVVDTLHGVAVPDPYRWLEAGDDPEVQQWVSEQNRHTRTALDALPERGAWHERLVALMSLPLVQAAAVCTAMKAAPANIKVYTVGFQLGSDTGVITMLTNCATSPADAYLADNATELNAAFAAIAEDISDLRLAQ